MDFERLIRDINVQKGVDRFKERVGRDGGPFANTPEAAGVSDVRRNIGWFVQGYHPSMRPDQVDHLLQATFQVARLRREIEDKQRKLESTQTGRNVPPNLKRRDTAERTTEVVFDIADSIDIGPKGLILAYDALTEFEEFVKGNRRPSRWRQIFRP